MTSAAFQELWQVGQDNSNNEEFPESQNNHIDPAPGSATALDDHYYLAGKHPAPIGLLEQNENTDFFESQTSSGDNRRRIYFPSPGANPEEVRYVLRFRTMWKGYWIPNQNSTGETPGNHHFIVRCNGVSVSETLIAPFQEQANDFKVSFAGQPLTAEGFNYIEIEHLGGTTPEGDPFPSGFWATLDFVNLHADPEGMLDTDEDGLPRYWESQYSLSDTHALDAGSDSDGDSLTASEEFALGTSPLSADTDRDGLADNLEILSNPLVSDTDDDGLKDVIEVNASTPSNPQLTDTDNDGASDSLELAAGTDPSNGSDTPAPFTGAIAINFVHNSDGFSSLQPTAATGVLPQTNWNQTRALNWGEETGDQSLIKQPIPGTIADASGNPTEMTLSWNNANPIPHSNLGEDTDLAAHRLFKGNLSAYSDGENADSYVDATLDLQNIPYPIYDLIVYLQSDGTEANCRITLNNDPQTIRNLNSLEYEILDGFRESITYGEDRISRGNYLRFRDLQGASCFIRLHSEAWQVLLPGLQILDMATDTDNDGMPDAWEREHGFDLADNTDGISDADEDGLSNAQEFAKRTKPRNPDSDGDGLSDLVETHTGTFVSESDTGTNPNHPDSDGDGISDYLEIAGSGFRTNPNDADSDGDAVEDGEEANWHADPNDISVNVVPIPVFNQAKDVLSWTIENLRIRLDYNNGRQLSEWGGGSLLEFQVLNGKETVNEWFTLNMRLTFNNGLIGYVFSANPSGGFADQGNGFNLAYWNYIPGQNLPQDITKAIGMSGTGEVDCSDRITLRFTATRSPSNSNSWTARYEIINQDTGQTVVDINRQGISAANSINNGTAFWNNHEGLPWPDVYVQQAALSFSFGDGPLEDQSLYQNIRDTDKDGLTDVFELGHSLDANDPSDGLLDNDGDGLDNLTEQRLRSDPNQADSDGDLVSDFWEQRYGSDPNNKNVKPFSFTNPPAGSFEDFDGDGLSDVWEYLEKSLDPEKDEDLDGFVNDTELFWGTDPFDSLSYPEIDVTQQGSRIYLRWPDLLYRDFDFEKSVNLADWTAVAGDVAGRFHTGTLDLPAEVENKWFFHLNMKDDLPGGIGDSDGDHLGSWAENLFGLSNIQTESLWNQTWVDDNGDGIPDREEYGDRYLLHALLADGMEGRELSEIQAARFLSQATFGPTSESINHLKSIGLEAWLAEQIEDMPQTKFEPVFLDFYADYHGPRVARDYYYFDDNSVLPMDNMRTAFGRAALEGPDQLRQRVAFALSQILVVSGQDANINHMPVSLARYYDNFVGNAFGNYYDILEYVTFNACMGLYLSHVGNQKAQPELNIFPDENFARELMQLFTIGLWELNPDGTRKLGTSGEPIPTYGQIEITELARVMTGFWFAGRNFGDGAWTDQSGLNPMGLHVSRHDFNSKTLVGEKVIPAREPTLDNAYQDIKDALRIIFEHPNTPVFISKQLIQFLVSDNPSPAYVERIQNVFVDNGMGVRGDLGAVVRAILLDQEARSALQLARSDRGGFLKEPVLRLMQLGRVFKVARNPDFQMWQLFSLAEEFNQDPLNAPSVFNFFKPQYEPAGILGDQGLVGPAFQILHSYSAISGPQQIWRFLQEGFSHPWRDDLPQPFDYSEFIPLEKNAEALIERINLLLCQGMMSPGTRTAIENALTKLSSLENLPPGVPTQVAVWVAVCGPSGATQL